MWVLPWVRKIPWRKKWQPNILAWKIPGIEEPRGLQSMGLQRVGHNYVCTHTQIKFKNSVPQSHYLHFKCSMAKRGYWLPHWIKQIQSISIITNVLLDSTGSGPDQILRTWSCVLFNSSDIGWKIDFIHKKSDNKKLFPNILLICTTNYENNNNKKPLDIALEPISFQSYFGWRQE